MTKYLLYAFFTLCVLSAIALIYYGPKYDLPIATVTISQAPDAFDLEHPLIPSAKELTVAGVLVRTLDYTDVYGNVEVFVGNNGPWGIFMVTSSQYEWTLEYLSTHPKLCKWKSVLLACTVKKITLPIDKKALIEFDGVQFLVYPGPDHPLISIPWY